MNMGHATKRESLFIAEMLGNLEDVVEVYLAHLGLVKVLMGKDMEELIDCVVPFEKSRMKGSNS